MCTASDEGLTVVYQNQFAFNNRARHNLIDARWHALGVLRNPLVKQKWCKSAKGRQDNPRNLLFSSRKSAELLLSLWKFDPISVFDVLIVHILISSLYISIIKYIVVITYILISSLWKAISLPTAFVIKEIQKLNEKNLKFLKRVLNRWISDYLLTN